MSATCREGSSATSAGLRAILRRTECEYQQFARRRRWGARWRRRRWLGTGVHNAVVPTCAGVDCEAPRPGESVQRVAAVVRVQTSIRVRRWQIVVRVRELACPRLARDPALGHGLRPAVGVAAIAVVLTQKRACIEANRVRQWWRRGGGEGGGLRGVDQGVEEGGG